MASQRTYDVPLGRLFSVAPGIPTTDMARTVEHYQRLGFTFSAPGSAAPPGEASFSIGDRDGVSLHFALKPDHDPSRTATWVYISVEDADELSAEFDASGAGQGRTPRDTDYKMRELAHIDPDGNLLLFGSPLAEDPAGRPAGEQVAGQDPTHCSTRVPTSSTPARPSAAVRRPSPPWATRSGRLCAGSTSAARR